MKQALYKLAVVELILICLILARGATSMTILAINYERAYQSSRNQLEAFARTTGRHVTSAYTCKLKNGVVAE